MDIPVITMPEGYQLIEIDGVRYMLTTQPNNAAQPQASIDSQESPSVGEKVDSPFEIQPRASLDNSSKEIRVSGKETKVCVSGVLINSD